MKQYRWIILTFILLIIIIGISFIYLRQRQLLTFRSSPSNATPTNFPVLAPKIQQEQIQIEELDSIDIRTYIFHAKLTQPLYQSVPFLKGSFTIDGDPTGTIYYLNAGPLTKPFYFGVAENSQTSWKWVKVSELPQLIGETKNVLIYFAFPKTLTQFTPNSVQYSFAQNQQAMYLIIQKIIQGQITGANDPIELQIDQLGIQK